jgi:hypothetical protein
VMAIHFLLNIVIATNVVKYYRNQDVMPIMFLFKRGLNGFTSIQARDIARLTTMVKPPELVGAIP